MKMLVHVMPWFGDGKIHRMNRYLSNDPATITKQINVLRATRIGGQVISGVIMTWQGPLATFQHQAVTQWNTQCVQRGMLFGLLMDPWLAKLGSPGNSTPMASNVINALNDPSSQAMFNSSAYLPEKFILDFNISGGQFNMSTDVAPQFPTLKFLEQGAGFSWPSINMGIPDSDQRNAACVSSLTSQNSNAAMRIPGICLGFNDSGMPTPAGVTLGNFTGTRDWNSSVWSPTVGAQVARVLDPQGGNFFYDQVAPSVTPFGVPYWAFVTWNDYDERTAIEDAAAAMCGLQIGQ